MNVLCSALTVWLLAAPAALAADRKLLDLAPPDAKVFAGLDVSRLKPSAFGQFVLSHMQPSDDEAFQKFLTAADLDLKRDVTGLVVFSPWQDGTVGRWVTVARGAFDVEKLNAAAAQSGFAPAPFQGVNMFVAGDSAIALLDPTTAAIGDPDLIKGVIQRFQTKAGGELPQRVQDVSGRDDFWLVSLVPISQFADVVTEATLAQAFKSGALDTIQQASGGVKFTGETVAIHAEFTALNHHDAQGLEDVLRFLGSMIALNREKNKTAAQVGSLVDTMTLSTEGDVMRLSMSVPAQVLDQLVVGALANPSKKP